MHTLSLPTTVLFLLTQIGGAGSEQLLERAREAFKEDAVQQRLKDVESKKPRKHAGPVEFVNYREEGRWEDWGNEQFTIRIPEDWSISLLGQEEGDRTSYCVRDAAGERKFEVLVVKGGPEFIECFCAPYGKYEYTKRGPWKMWALSMTLGPPSNPLRTRTIKVSNKELRLDIHAELPSEDGDKVRYIAESARVVK